MENIGSIEIHISGSKGNLALNPDTYDIREVKAMLDAAEALLFPSEKKVRPLITYDLEQGSVRNIFKTSIQAIIGFNAIIGQIAQQQSIDFLDLPTARAIEAFQDAAVKKNYTFSITTSLADTNKLQIDRSTALYKTEAIWANAEFYFYGRITNAGGKDKANLHLSTSEYGTLRIATPMAYLEAYEDNLLYKNFGVRAVGRQHTKTGELDSSSLEFIELIDYQPRYDAQYLAALRKKAKSSWLGNLKDPDAWLREIRGGYEA